MDLKCLIEKGNEKAGSQTELAIVIGVPRDHLTHAKAGRRGLPVAACFRLAALLGIDPATVTAASELNTEKDPKRREVFAPFVMGKAATFAGLALLGLTATTDESVAAANPMTTVSTGIHIMSTNEVRVLRVLKKDC